MASFTADNFKHVLSTVTAPGQIKYALSDGYILKVSRDHNCPFQVLLGTDADKDVKQSINFVLPRKLCP